MNGFHMGLKRDVLGKSWKVEVSGDQNYKIIFADVRFVLVIVCIMSFLYFGRCTSHLIDSLPRAANTMGSFSVGGANPI